MDVQYSGGVPLESSSCLLDLPSRLCAHSSAKMVDAFSQFSLDMHDGQADEQPDSILLYEEEEDQKVSNVK